MSLRVLQVPVNYAQTAAWYRAHSALASLIQRATVAACSLQAKRSDAQGEASGNRVS